jgi:hypothetical protein
MNITQVIKILVIIRIRILATDGCVVFIEDIPISLVVSTVVQ